MALIQHKQDLVKALKAQQYSAAAAVLEKALIMAPEDAQLLEFQAAVQAKLRLDHDVSSGSDADDDELGSSQDIDSDGSSAAGDEENDDDDGNADEEGSCSTSGAADEVASTSALTTSAAAVFGALLDGGCMQGSGAAQLQQTQQDRSMQACSRKADVSSISLAASSSTLTPQHRLQLRQQLAASISQHKDELVQQQLVKSDPLLA